VVVKHLGQIVTEVVNGILVGVRQDELRPESSGKRARACGDATKSEIGYDPERVGIGIEQRDLKAGILSEVGAARRWKIGRNVVQSLSEEELVGEGGTDDGRGIDGKAPSARGIGKRRQPERVL